MKGKDSYEESLKDFEKRLSSNEQSKEYKDYLPEAEAELKSHIPQVIEEQPDELEDEEVASEGLEEASDDEYEEYRPRNYSKYVGSFIGLIVVGIVGFGVVIPVFRDVTQSAVNTTTMPSSFIKFAPAMLDLLPIVVIIFISVGLFGIVLRMVNFRV